MSHAFIFICNIIPYPPIRILGNDCVVLNTMASNNSQRRWGKFVIRTDMDKIFEGIKDENKCNQCCKQFFCKPGIQKYQNWNVQLYR